MVASHLLDMAVAHAVLVLATAGRGADSSAAVGAPEQVHLSYSVAQDGMRVAWSTVGSGASMTASAESNVNWGRSRGALDHTAEGTARAFTADGAVHSWTGHVAEMTGLQPGERVFYRVGGAVGGWSPVHSFTVMRASGSAATHQPQRHAFVGDLGTPYMHALCPACTDESETCICRGANRTSGLVAELSRGTRSVIHVGDLACENSCSCVAVGIS
eukprot:SAG31_NODE_1919_length_6920_cov_5.391731_1_plen_216_part_00